MFSLYRRRATAGLGILCLVSGIPGAGAQVSLPPAQPPAAITALEYFLDTDPGMGKGTAIPASAGADISASPSLSLSNSQPGIHRLYFRAKDANGNWGLSSLRLLYLAPALPISASAPADVTALEYFFDADPGFGLGTPLPLSAGPDISFQGAVNTASLGAGVHYFGVRSKNSKGQWGLTTIKPVYVLPALSLPAQAAAAPIVRAEYFVDNDPGTGRAPAVPMASGTDVEVAGFVAAIGTLGSGVHQIGIRFQDAAGNWSLTNRRKLAVIVADIDIPPAIPARPFTTLEYFFDTDPGMGNGTLLSVPATTDLSSFSFAADISSLAGGPHLLYARTVGDWSITSSRAFTIGSPLPVALARFDAQRQGASVLLEWEAAYEKGNRGFTIERSADAKAFDSLGFVPATADVRYAFRDRQPLAGSSYYRLKQAAPDGKISYSRTLAIRFGNAPGQLFTCNNPVHDELRIFWNGKAPEQSGFSIINLQGQEVGSFSGSGKAVESCPVSQLPPGSYLLRGRAGAEIQTLRFQKR